MSPEESAAGPRGRPAEDPYARSEYRRLIAWEPRIRREAPFLLALLERAPDRSVADLGCGTGEHTAFFAREGARAVGIDRSEDMLAAAREHEARGEGRFVAGDITRAPAALAPGEAPFGLAICLGNTLPHLLDDTDLAAFLDSVRSLLAPGGVLLIQILNYRRILDQGIRHLPLNFRPAEEGDTPPPSREGGRARAETVFLRLLQPLSERRILFFPATLVLDPESEEPVRVTRSRRVELRPWTREELEPALETRGFRVELHGDMEGGAYEESRSADLVVVAVRAG